MQETKTSLAVWEHYLSIDHDWVWCGRWETLSDQGEWNSGQVFIKIGIIIDLWIFFKGRPTIWHSTSRVGNDWKIFPAICADREFSVRSLAKKMNSHNWTWPDCSRFHIHFNGINRQVQFGKFIFLGFIEFEYSKIDLFFIVGWFFNTSTTEIRQF